MVSREEIAFTVANAALHSSLHSLRILANRGLVSPKDLDESLEGVFETLENLPTDWLAIFQKRYDPLFAELKRVAAVRWDGVI